MEPVNFADHIAPILAANCASCHHPNGIGPFSLLTFDDARRRSRQIAEVTQSGFMPPWKPSREHGPALIGERTLTTAQIQQLTQWHEQGSPAGDLTKLPPPVEPASTWTLGPPDLVIRLPESYTLPAEGRDVYRNFAIPVALTEPRFVRALQFRPAPRSPIHHALVLLDQTGRAREQDETETGPGYDGMGIGSGTPPSGHIVGWTPGQSPYEAYPGTAWEITPQTDLVIQLHLLPTGRPESIAPEIGLYFANQPPDRESFVIQLRNYEIAIPAGESTYQIEESLTLPTPVQVLSLYPHAHYLGKDLQIFATLPSGEKQWLLHIPDWDFNWQGDYRLQSPLALPAGAEISMVYTFDNSAANPFNPSNPPVDVSGGWSSTDEMAEAMIQVLPASADDLAALSRAQKDYDIAKAGGEARYHYFNGIYLEEQGEFQQAFVAYESSRKLDPTFASVYFKLGGWWERQSDPARAFELYQTALLHQPTMISARLAQAKLLVQHQQFSAAGELIQAVHAENPRHLLATLYLARFHLAVDDFPAALATFRAGLAHFAESPEFHYEYGETLWRTDQIKAAEKHFEIASSSTPAGLALGSTRALLETRAAAFHRLALIALDRSETVAAQNHLEQCLIASPRHLDALLLAADLALRSADHATAEAHLFTLLSLPEQARFSDEDILANLPQPAGRLALAQAYTQRGNPDQAQHVINLANRLMTAPVQRPKR